jgi:hypothetical protein
MESGLAKTWSDLEGSNSGSEVREQRLKEAVWSTGQLSHSPAALHSFVSLSEIKGAAVLQEDLNCLWARTRGIGLMLFRATRPIVHKPTEAVSRGALADRMSLSKPAILYPRPAGALPRKA